MKLLAGHEIQYIDGRLGERLQVSGVSYNHLVDESTQLYIEVDRLKSEITFKKTRHSGPQHEEFNGESVALPDNVDSRSDHVLLYWKFGL